METQKRPGPSLLACIAGFYPSLNEAERKVADFISISPEAARGCSIIRLSELTGVSQTTIVRFCRTIGFDGYTDFKMALVAELAPRPGALPLAHGDVLAEDSLVVLVEKVLHMDVQALANTLEALDMDAFGRAVEALSGAKSTAILGVGSSLPIAMDLHYRFRRTGIAAHFSVDSHMQVMDAAGLQPGDVALAISYSGDTRETLEAVELAKESGATTICVTNFPRSSLARLCDICLVTSAKKTRWLDETITARLVQLALFDALCVAIARQRETEIIPILERIDSAVERVHRR
jgi:DNA-binding MurR/RpiR family transcriptional regulator